MLGHYKKGSPYIEDIRLPAGIAKGLPKDNYCRHDHLMGDSYTIIAGSEVETCHDTSCTQLEIFELCLLDALYELPEFKVFILAVGLS
jgi:hypothetical protein